MNGYPCKNADRGCTAKVLKSRDDGKYHEILENGTMGARHFCKFWPKKGENDTPEQVLAEQKRLMSVPQDVKQEFAKIEQEVAKNEVKEYSNGDIMLAVNNLQISVSKVESIIRTFTKEVGEALAKMSFEKASKLK